MHNESNVRIAQIGYDRIKQKKLSLIETIFFYLLEVSNFILTHKSSQASFSDSGIIIPLLYS